MTVRVFHTVAFLAFVGLAGCGADPDGSVATDANNFTDFLAIEEAVAPGLDVATEATAGDAAADRGAVDATADGAEDAADAPHPHLDAQVDASADASQDATPAEDASGTDVRADTTADLVDATSVVDAIATDARDVIVDMPGVIDAVDVRDVTADNVDVAVVDAHDAAADILVVADVIDVPDVRDAVLDSVAVDVRDAAVDVVDVADVPDVRDAAVDVADVPDVRDAAVDVVDVPDVRDAAIDVVDVVDVRDAADATPDTTVPPDSPADVATDTPSDVVIPPDPVMYTGTLPIHTDGAVFMTRFQVLGNNRDVWVLMPRVLPRNAPLVLGFHGTNSDGAVFLSESGAAAVSDAQGVVFIAPTSRWFSETGADFDHPGGNGTYWETANNTNPNTNEDLVLTRAIIQEARRVYGIDPTRVYAYGHSNGGFMAYMVSQVLRDRVVGFGENASGLSRCNPQQTCRFQGSGSTCAALATQSGWCACTGAELPIAVGATGRRTPGVLFHGTADPLVSVYHTCTLEARMRAVGNPVQTTLFDGGGHADFSTFASRMWSYLSVYRLP